MSNLTNGQSYDPVDDVLNDMRDHVSNLQDKLTFAGNAIGQSQGVNEKIAIMKEYQEKATSLNSCWRSKNRTGLVANLQRESRQILALEEENRQLRCALREMEGGLHLVMTEYRRLASEFSHSDLNNFAISRILNAEQNSDRDGLVDIEQLFKLAKASEHCLKVAEEKIASDQAIIAQLRSENEELHLKK